MSQDGFRKRTVETLAKRSGYICSNPDCQKQTVGPNDDPVKSTIIGEAAHIYGRAMGSTRYRPEMSLEARNELTNGIWLCRNCHKLVDSDEEKYPAELLFLWRSDHEEHQAKSLGKRSDAIRIKLDDKVLSRFKNMPGIIERIVLDKPPGWEWRLTAELLRHMNEPIEKKYQSLKNGFYSKPVESVPPEHVFRWAQSKFANMQTMVSPLGGLLNKFNEDWGKTGIAGDPNAILDTCELLSANLQRILDFEETVYFADVPDENRKLKSLIQDAVGSQMLKVFELPDHLDEFVEFANSDHGGTIDNPAVIHKTLTFELPDRWERDITRELGRVQNGASLENPWGVLFWIILFGAIAFVLML